MSKLKAVNTIPVELTVRDDIYDAIISRYKQATVKQHLCTSCMGKVLANGETTSIDVTRGRIEYAKCFLCAAVTTNHACVTLGVIPQELQRIIDEHSTHFVSMRNTVYSVKRIPFQV